MLLVKIFRKFLRKVSYLINYLYNKKTFIIANITGNFIHGKPIIINGRVNISNRGNIVIGDMLRINSGKNFNIIGGSTRMNFQVCDNACLRIGNNVGMSNSSIAAHKSVVIDDNVMIGGNCKIYDTDFHSLNFEERMNESKNNHLGVKTSAVHIKNGAFIGAHFIILKGVTIGETSIVGAGSVVAKSIPDAEIWAGNPAKFIRKVERTYDTEKMFVSS